MANNDSYTLAKNTPLTVPAPGVLGNDTGGPLTAVLVSGPAHGTLAVNADGSFTYTPAAGYTGADSFTYKANDGQLDSNVATVSLTVTDTAPVANGDSYTANANTALTVPAPGVLGNDTDANGDALTAVLVSGPAHGTLAVNADGSFTYTPAAGYTGPDSFTYKANDGQLDSNVATVSLTVADTTPPSILVPANITAEATSPAGAAVHFTVLATDNAGPAAVSCDHNSGDTFPLGTTTVVCTATDASGNTASGTFTVTVVDTTPPTLNLPGAITAKATANSHATVTYTATATDLVDGPVPVTCTPPSGSSFPAGTTTVGCSATDAHGNTATGSFTVTVGYAWNGFFQPVDNPPTVNTVKAGSAIPVKFTLTGNQGLNIFASGYPASAAYTCNSSAPTDAIETTVTAGSSSLSYDATSDQYTYVWKTNKAWAGTCRALVVKLADGTAHTADFQFTK